MAGLISSLVWRGISEAMLVRNDIKRFRGKKNVLVVLAPDRTHPGMVEAKRLYEQLTGEDWAFVKEDYPEGRLHERFQCPPQEFRVVVVDKEGEVRSETQRVLPLNEVFEKVTAEARQRPQRGASKQLSHP
jgi:hypothetical protein